MMIKYVEIALGSTSNRGRAIPISEIAKYQKIAQDTHQELYRSYYYFDYTLVEHLQAYKTVKGYNGSPIIETLTLDIDKNGDTDEQVHKRAITFFHRLKNFDIKDQNIRSYYSGSGYHFILPNLWNFHTYQEVKETFLSLFPECDSIYDRTRIIRVSNTINFKTQRYKIPLTLQELLYQPTEIILQFALTTRSSSFSAFEENNDLEYTKIKPSVILTDTPKIVSEEGMNPVTVCIQKLYNSSPVEGYRHKSILRMVSVFKRNGVPRSAIETMIREWSKGQMESGEIRKIVEDIFTKNYQYSCEDEIMKKYCDERCIFYKRKSFNAVLPQNVDAMDDAFRSFATTSQSSDYIELQKHVHCKDSFKIYPAEFVCVWGDTGTGKSSLIQNWCINEPRYKVLYVNTEVGERLMYRRELQIAHSMTKQDILQYYSDPQAPSLSGKVNHIHMVSASISLPILEQTIVAGSYKLVVLDVLGDLHIPGETDITQKTAVIAPALKQLAVKLNIILIAVHHIPKSKAEDAEGRSRKLTKHSGAGSAAIEDKADKIILLEGNEKSPYRRISSAKARDESPFDTTLMFDAERTFRFYKEPIWQKQNLTEIDSSSSLETVTLISPGINKV
jgi:archaellum biogenesis ATPase FlaH